LVSADVSITAVPGPARGAGPPGGPARSGS